MAISGSLGGGPRLAATAGGQRLTNAKRMDSFSMEKRQPRKKPPKGLVTERTLRSMIRTIAKKLKTELSVEESLALLKQQERLAKQLAKVDAANAAQET